MKNYTWQIIAMVAVIAVGVSIVYSNSVSNKANEGISFEKHIRGNAEAKVVITEYSDFQCPACGQFFNILETVLAEKGDDVQLEYKHFPLTSIHPFAIPAAKASEAAGQQGKFFEMHDKLFQNQQIWSKGPNPNSYFMKYAQDIGLDMALFKTHMKASIINDKISDEFKEARALGLGSTPSFFLNGVPMQFESYQGFIDQVDSAISKTKTSVTGNQEVKNTDTTEEVRFGF